jgi:glycosyltransferase involved in cell wall biosynthesis
MPRLSSAGIIATFNQEEYIEESVRSLAPQVDELIVIDDHSSDGTLAVLRGLEIPNMTLISHSENVGVSSSCNEAVNRATADVIFFQGGDDVSLNNRVKNQIALLSDPGTVLCYGIPQVIDAKGNQLPRQAAPEFFSSIKVESVLEHLYFSGNFICAPTVAMRRELYLSLGGFNSALKHLQDFELWLRCATLGNFAVSDVSLLKYRKHSRNISREDLLIPNESAARFDAEMDYVLGSVIEKMGVDAIEKLLSHLGLGGAVCKGVDQRILIALLQINHKSVSQNRRGLSYVFELIGDLGDIHALERFGISDNFITELSMRCDHNNRVFQSKAISSLSKLGVDIASS